VGPFERELAGAVRAAWSLVRLRWETEAHSPEHDSRERGEADDAQIAIYEQYGARTLVVALTIVGDILPWDGWGCA
jgi:hypothetical protein